MLVVPQSVVLYSRFHLLAHDSPRRRCAGIVSANIIWDRVQVTIFFLQETIISVLYIVETRRVLLNRSILGQDDKMIRTVMWHLIYTNILVVFLDCALLAMSYSPHFYPSLVILEVGEEVHYRPECMREWSRTNKNGERDARILRGYCR
jgi:hypothetical protein